MIISKELLHELVQQRTLQENVTYFRDSKRPEVETYDVFLSYSYHDKEFALLLVQLLEKEGLTIYIDLKDNSLDRGNVNSETAMKIAQKMNRCRSLVFLYSKAASISKWCPWELGYVSGIRNFRCAKIPLVQKRGINEYEKQEYLEIYPTIDYEKSSESGEYTFWVNNADGKYIHIKEWINGKSPYKH